MREVKITQAFEYAYGGHTVKPMEDGKVLPESDAAAQHALKHEYGALVPLAGETKEVEKGPEDTAERQAAITEAIGGLDADNEEYWIGSGAPNVNAIEAALGWNISAGERNESWDAIQEAKSE